MRLDPQLVTDRETATLPVSYETIAGHEVILRWAASLCRAVVLRPAGRSLFGLAEEGMSNMVTAPDFIGLGDEWTSSRVTALDLIEGLTRAVVVVGCNAVALERSEDGRRFMSSV